MHLNQTLIHQQHQLQDYFNNINKCIWSIDEITITESGGGYQIVPGITTITSDLGSGAVVETFSSTIGKPTKISLENIGFDYPTDSTLKPEVLISTSFKNNSIKWF